MNPKTTPFSTLRKGLLLPAVATALLFWVGCAGSLRSFDRGADLPKELPKDIAERFEVKEVDPSAVASPEPSPLPSPLPSPTPSALLGKKPPKNRKTVKKLIVDPSPPPAGEGGAFTYPDRMPQAPAVWPGEKHHLQMLYAGLVVGLLDIEVQPYKVIQGRRVMPIQAHAMSSAVFSLFYKLDDFITSFWDSRGLFSHRFQLALNESKQQRNSLELNDSEKAESYYYNRIDKLNGQDPEEKSATFPMLPISQDSLSAIYWMRSLPLEQGQTYEFPVISEGKIFETFVTPVLEDELSTAMGAIQSVKVKVDVKEHGSGANKGQGFFWFSNDARRKILRFEAKVRVGSVAAVIRDFTPGESPVGQ